MTARQTDELWNCVQAALDAGREPLEDPGVLALWSEATGAERDDVARLLARLEALPPCAPPMRPSVSPASRVLRTALPWAMAASLLALPFVSQWTRDPQPNASEVPSAIYEAQLSVRRFTPPPARLQRATRAVERHFTWNVAGESGRLEVR